MNQKRVSGADYKRIYVPVGAWVLIEKDLLPEKTEGGIFLPQKHREAHTKTTQTGVIVAKSPFSQFENSWEAYLYSIYEIGDRVGFSDTTPILSPAPPDMAFGEDCDTKFVTMHISDILMVFCDTEEKLENFTLRCGVKHGH